MRAKLRRILSSEGLRLAGGPVYESSTVGPAYWEAVNAVSRLESRGARKDRHLLKLVENVKKALDQVKEHLDDNYEGGS